jgi:hypothetical protein
VSLASSQGLGSSSSGGHKLNLERLHFRTLYSAWRTFTLSWHYSQACGDLATSALPLPHTGIFVSYRSR